jgi:hypothetical protein
MSTSPQQKQKLTSNLSDITLGDPRVPVVDQSVPCGVAILQLPEGVLIDDVVVTGVFEQRWLE